MGYTSNSSTWRAVNLRTGVGSATSAFGTASSVSDFRGAVFYDGKIQAIDYDNPGIRIYTSSTSLPSEQILLNATGQSIRSTYAYRWFGYCQRGQPFDHRQTNERPSKTRTHLI